MLLGLHSPFSPPPSFTQSPFPPRSLVRDRQTSPHTHRLVVSYSTCPPLSQTRGTRTRNSPEPGPGKTKKTGAPCVKVPGSSTGPTFRSFVIGPAVINNNTAGKGGPVRVTIESRATAASRSSFYRVGRVKGGVKVNHGPMLISHLFIDLKLAERHFTLPHGKPLCY